MKCTFRIIAAISMVLIIAAAAVAAQNGEMDKIREELGVKRMVVIYPEPGAEISNAAPSVAVDTSGLEFTVDPVTVEVTLDGAEITTDCDINEEYIFCSPRKALAAGRHDVRVTGRDINGNSLEPLGWNFTVKTGAAVPIPEGKQDRTSGKWGINLADVEARYTPNAVFNAADLFETSEGVLFQYDMNFSNVSMGRTLTGVLHREVQSYSNISVDQGRINYQALEYEFDAGDFWVEYSPLTLGGAHLRGIEYRDPLSDGSWAVFAGRSQDPSTSGRFKQQAAGVKRAWSVGGHEIQFAAMQSREKIDARYLALSNPQSQSLAGIQDRITLGGGYLLTLEAAGSELEPFGARVKQDWAGRAGIEKQTGEFTWSLLGFSYGNAFYPLAEGSMGNLYNDKRGGRFGFNWLPNAIWTLAGDYERYRSENNGARTFEKQSQQVRVRPGGDNMPEFSYRHSGLEVTGASENNSRSDLASVNWSLPGTRWTGESGVMALWQSIKYSGRLTAGNIDSRTRQRFYSFNTNLLGRFIVSMSRSDANTSDRVAATRARSRNERAGLRWTITEFKRLLEFNYNLQRKISATADNRERSLELKYKRFYQDGLWWSLGHERILYTDRTNRFYNYEQYLWTLELGGKF